MLGGVFVKEKLKQFAIITLGAVLCGLGLYYFKIPNHFSTGGVSSISIILGGMIPGISTGTINFALNMALLLVGFLFFGKSFGVKTAYASTLMSSVVSALEILHPLDGPFTDQPLLELIFAVGIPSVGSAMLFNAGASTGGTDVIAMIVKKYSSIDIGKALLISDVAIVIVACFVFDIETGMFSILGLVMKTLVVDMVIESINLNKFFTIVTTKPDEIIHYIHEELHRGATVEEAQGSFTHEKKYVILTATKRQQAVALRTFARQQDPHAFIMITNSSEIVGKGFMRI